MKPLRLPQDLVTHWEMQRPPVAEEDDFWVRAYLRAVADEGSAVAVKPIPMRIKMETLWT